MSIDQTLASLHDLPTKNLESMSVNCTQALLKQSDDSDARLLRDAIDALYVTRSGVTEGWTTGSQGEPRLFLVSGNVHGAVRRIQTHTGVRKGVYLVEVGGAVVEKGISEVDDARAMVESLLSAGSAI